MCLCPEAASVKQKPRWKSRQFSQSHTPLLKLQFNERLADDITATAFQTGLSKPDRPRLHQHLQRLKLGSGRVRGELVNILSDAIGPGVNLRDTAKVISKCLNVLMARAKNIAQT